MVSHRMRIGGAVVALSALAMLAAACSSGGSSNANAAPTDQTGFAAYTACLAKNGVTLAANSARPSRSPGAGRPTARPSGESGGGQRGGGFGGFGTEAPAGVDAATWAKAQQACASVRPTGGPNGGFGGGANNSALTAYRNCLSDHGVTATAGAGQFNTADPKVAAAMTACAPLRPTARPNPTPTPAT